MIYDTIARLARYDGPLPGAQALARMLAAEGFDPDDPATHAGYEVRHKAYGTRDDAARQFEVHDHTVDLMVCLSGAECIHLCDAGDLAPGAPLPGGADGRKLVGGPRGSVCLLRAGHFIAIQPGEAHMVAGHVKGAPTAVDKLVIKVPVPDARMDDCPCTGDCARHGQCAQCVVWHRSPDNSLPFCLRAKGAILIERATQG